MLTFVSQRRSQFQSRQMSTTEDKTGTGVGVVRLTPGRGNVHNSTIYLAECLFSGGTLASKCVWEPWFWWKQCNIKLQRSRETRAPWPIPNPPAG